MTILFISQLELTYMQNLSVDKETHNYDMRVDNRNECAYSGGGVKEHSKLELN